jgi:type IV secretory pathway TraG/TraD family ATPase VirD4
MRVNGLPLGLAAASFASAVACHSFCAPPLGCWLPAGAVLLGSWQLYCAVRPWWAPARDVVLRLWGLEWTRDEACCHFFITGGTGTGKTARAVVPVIHGLRETQPDTRVLAIDSKGALWQPMAAVARALGQEDSLRLIRVRPTDHPADRWVSPLRLNVLADRSVPWSTYAKILIDTATAAGQRGGQTFFKEAARDAITHAMQALAILGDPVTLDAVHGVLCVSEHTAALFPRLEKLAPTPQAAAADAELKFFRDFVKQPPEQKGGTIFTIANFLRPYTPPDIADVVCSRTPNFSIAEVDQGRLVCLSVPQAYQVERKYLNLLFKQLFFLHAFRRFDLSPAEMHRRNLIALVLDEGQKTTLVSEDGFSDHGTVDELREAGVCLISATQTPLSLYASFETPTKADVFMANLRTQIHFRAADEKGAKIISERMGGREVRKYSGGVSGGRTSRNWQPVDEPWFKPTRLLSLPFGHAVVHHPRRTGRPLLHALPFTPFTLPNKNTPADPSRN